MHEVSRDAVFMYGVGTGTAGTLVVVFVCIAIGERVHRWRMRRRWRRRG